jgi:hypothetical protein
MKKLSVSLMILIFACLIGCAGVSVATNDSANIAGKVAGVYVASKYPAASAMILTYARGMLSVAEEGKLSSDQITTAVAALYGQIGNDAELRTLVVAMTGAVTIEIKTGEVNSQAVSALKGFIAGLQLGTV